ncbi:MAG TPA: hypothetical protein PLF31_02990 [Candidatus Paceibacterota bacterium]|nr:hypothetical protein [Candidatus Paceibacterota bacterium]
MQPPHATLVHDSRLRAEQMRGWGTIVPLHEHPLSQPVIPPGFRLIAISDIDEIKDVTDRENFSLFANGPSVRIDTPGSTHPGKHESPKGVEWKLYVVPEKYAVDIDQKIGSKTSL